MKIDPYKHKERYLKWKKSDKIHYYSELLGMKDTISEDDLLIDVTKTEIEKRLTKAEQEVEFLSEDNKHMKNQMNEILKLISNAREIVVN